MKNNSGIKKEFLSQIADKIASVISDEFEIFIIKKFDDEKKIRESDLKSIQKEWLDINKELAERIKISATFLDPGLKNIGPTNTEKIIKEFKKKTAQLAVDLYDIDTTLYIENLMDQQEKMKLILK